MKMAAATLYVTAFLAGVFGIYGTTIAHGQAEPSFAFVNDLSIGSNNPEVALLQTMLISKGFSIPAIQAGIIPKGYFGQQTKAAVMRYQSSLGLAPTGFVGPLTRAKLNGLADNNSNGNNNGGGTQAGPLFIISPNGGESLQNGATEIIRWTSPAYFRATYADISLVPYYAPCDTRYPCPMFAYRAPYKIARNISINQNSYAWIVGSNEDAQSIPDGQYTIMICEATSAVCDSSNAPFTIYSGSLNTNGSPYAPVISSIQAPGQLQVAETGTWTIRASDPRSSTLNYSVTWGDERYYGVGLSGASNPFSQSFVQSATFSHAYANPGTYTVTFTVTNSAGLTSRSTATVTVVGSTSTAAASITMVSPNGGENWLSGTNQTIRWSFNQGAYYGSYGSYGNTYQNYSVDIVITPYQTPCSAGIYCFPNALAPYKIATGIPASQQQYIWNVGSISYNQMNLPAGNYVVGVCFINTNNCALSDNPFIISDGNSGNQSSFIYSLTTDRLVYSQNDQVRVLLQAYNPTNYPITLSFTSGCETRYTIDNFDSNRGILCTANMPTETIGARSTKTWQMINDPSRYRIPVGTHTINASLLSGNSGSASAVIEVR
ncbi:MAG: hypothetical protein JWO73_693 [Candidatus Taylorbacteria bacterium]|nr:hypothetical protein [Candidatus Taylorbacteria bacterium]